MLFRSLILLKKSIRDFFDLSIFLNLDSSKRLNRRIIRDVKERGRSQAEVQKRFIKMINPMHDKFVEPSKKYADIILQSTYNEIFLKMIVSYIESNT